MREGHAAGRVLVGCARRQAAGCSCRKRASGPFGLSSLDPWYKGNKKAMPQVAALAVPCVVVLYPVMSVVHRIVSTRWEGSRDKSSGGSR
jgi:hypothetical protein